jgi:uroporphyrinogen-III synthase
VKDKRVLLPRADVGSVTLEHELRAGGADPHPIVVYRQEPRSSPTPATESALRSGTVDWVAVTSSNVAMVYMAWLKTLSPSRMPKLAAISENVASVLIHADYLVDAIANKADMSSLADAIVVAHRTK